ncbi:hypothetical protein Zmor_021512 [Zophobas morio]|uniref:Uncharacterized protein n=1 Tax=Zophobas morio TaxID=2755281 RepID=A0AA38MAJ8_9CUCU|nr:hypothetical protein Zmor_021512 [Zophobas morio]
MFGVVWRERGAAQIQIDDFSFIRMTVFLAIPNAANTGYAKGVLLVKETLVVGASVVCPAVDGVKLRDNTCRRCLGRRRTQDGDSVTFGVAQWLGCT